MAIITELRAENVQRLKAVVIRPDGAPLVQITGKNAQGKTSVLDSMAIALGGKKWLAAKPIRDGADRAEVVVTLDDGMVIKRTITQGGGGGSLTVTAADGSRMVSPQSVLDRMAESLSFDPLAFSRMKPADQVEALKRIVGLDFGEMDAKRAELFASRSDVNRDAKSLQARAQAAEFYADAPAEEVSIAELSQRNVDAGQKDRAADTAANKATRAAEGVQRADEEIAELNERLKGLRINRDKLNLDAVDLKEKADAANRERVPVQLIADALTEAEATNRKVRANKERNKLMAEYESKTTDADLLTVDIEEIDKQKRDRLAAAKFPVDGLLFDDLGVIYQGQPFTQASGAEKLRVSVGMALAAAPQLKVLLIRDGSLLDLDNLATIAEMAEAAGAQVWIERVGTGGVGIEIVEGEVAEA